MSATFSSRRETIVDEGSPSLPEGRRSRGRRCSASWTARSVPGAFARRECRRSWSAATSRSNAATCGVLRPQRRRAARITRTPWSMHRVPTPARAHRRTRSPRSTRDRQQGVFSWPRCGGHVARRAQAPRSRIAVSDRASFPSSSDRSAASRHWPLATN